MTLYEHRLIHRTFITREHFNKFSRFAKFNRSSDTKFDIDHWRGSSEQAKELSGKFSYAKPKRVKSSPTYSSTLTDGTVVYHDKDAQKHAKRIGDKSVERLSRLMRPGGLPGSMHSVQFIYFGDLLSVVFDNAVGEVAILLGGKYGGTATPYHGGNKTEEEFKKDLYKWAENISAKDADGKTLSGEDFIKRLNIKEGGNVHDTTYDNRAGRDIVRGMKLSGGQRDRLQFFKVILGSFAYKDYVDDQEKIINMAHFPISMDYFNDFFYERVVRSKRTYYSFQDFCIDVLNDIIMKNLSRECFGGYFKNDSRSSISLLGAQGTTVRSSTVPQDPVLGFWSTKSGYDYKDLKLYKASANNPIFFVSTKSNRAKDYHYMMFTVNSVRAFNQRLDGDVENDREKGIPHFQFGNTKGLLKSANFTKTPLQYHAEQRWAEEGSDNMLNQLAGVYEMQLNMIGNNLFIPGQYIYFNPIAMGIGPPNYRNNQTRSFANRMGLGGYHLITEVAGRITPGKFETSIKSIWETTGKNTG
jgi:hypothetical protein